MKKNVDELLTAARVLMDRNLGASDAALIDEGEESALTLDEMLRASVERAARLVAEGAPTYLLQEVMADGSGVQPVWDTAVPGAGRVALPADFLRLVWFKMSDWRYGLTTALTPDNALYAAQRSAFPGLRGSVEKPVMVLVPAVGAGRKWALEFYCSDAATARVEALTYVPAPKVSGTGAAAVIELAPLLADAVAAEMAALVLRSLGEGDMSGAMEQVAQRLMRTGE